ncbi:MAG: DUF302 domain-containing protein [Gemmatimonadales bacterium]
MTHPTGFEVRLKEPFDAAVDRTRDALKAEGFGILTEIDLKAAFREKLGREFRPYIILGACNPPLAFSAVTADPSVGLLLPCNVTVEAAADGNGTTVRLTDPEAMLAGHQTGAEVRKVAEDARARILRVRKTLAGTAD